METRIKILALAIIGIDYLQDLEEPLNVIINFADSHGLDTNALKNAVKRLENEVVKRADIVSEKELALMN